MGEITKSEIKLTRLYYYFLSPNRKIISLKTKYKQKMSNRFSFMKALKSRVNKRTRPQYVPSCGYRQYRAPAGKFLAAPVVRRFPARKIPSLDEMTTKFEKVEGFMQEFAAYQILARHQENTYDAEREALMSSMKQSESEISEQWNKFQRHVCDDVEKHLEEYEEVAVKAQLAVEKENKL